MRIAYLTTRTLHHAWLLQELRKSHDVGLVLLQTGCATPPFAVSHPFEEEREHYEAARWFSNRTEHEAWMGPTHSFHDLNSEEPVCLLKEYRPDIVIVFGTNRLSQAVIDICPQGIINLHGGNPEEYRGLDTHLWAIYHNDPGGLVVTLHFVNAGLDSGQIIDIIPVPLSRGMHLKEIRAATTEAAFTLVSTQLQRYEQNNSFVSRSQSRIGRYYSYMPSCLKDICVAKFKRITESL